MPVSESTGSMWNEVEDIPDPNLRTMDEQVEMRCKTKRLADCELPEGFRLVTPAPRQYWLDHQLRWCFELRFGEHRHVARYIQQATDELQMQWAISDFTADLLFKGISLNPNKKRHITGGHITAKPFPRVSITGCGPASVLQ